MVIYKITNTINQKCYIRQSKDFHHRMIAHKSDAYNKRCHNYTLPLYCAIRKYGWDNFTKEILEEAPAGLNDTQMTEWANEREQFYIKKYNSRINDKGYNISEGGGQSPRGKLTFEEKVETSDFFNIEEVRDIQKLLSQGVEKKEIIAKYAPKLKESFLDNINCGANFYDPKLTYPLFDYMHSGYSKFFSKEEQRKIREDIMSGMIYSDINKKWGITPGTISTINNGSIWRDNQLTYPLCVKGTSRIHNWEAWVKKVIDDIEHSNMNLKEIAQKYNKAYSTITKINQGCSYRDPTKKYPLIKYRDK